MCAGKIVNGQQPALINVELGHKYDDFISNRMSFNIRKDGVLNWLLCRGHKIMLQHRFTDSLPKSYLLFNAGNGIKEIFRTGQPIKCNKERERLMPLPVCPFLLPGMDCFPVFPDYYDYGLMKGMVLQKGLPIIRRFIFK